MFAKMWNDYQAKSNNSKWYRLRDAERAGKLTDRDAAWAKRIERQRQQEHYETMQEHDNLNRLSWRSIVSAWQRVNTPVQPPTAWLDITGQRVDMIDYDAQLGDRAYARTTLEWARQQAAAARAGDAKTRREIVLRQTLGDSARYYNGN